MLSDTLEDMLALLSPAKSLDLDSPLPTRRFRCRPPPGPYLCPLGQRPPNLHPISRLLRPFSAVF